MFDNEKCYARKLQERWPLMYEQNTTYRNASLQSRSEEARSLVPPGKSNNTNRVQMGGIIQWFIHDFHAWLAWSDEVQRLEMATSTSGKLWEIWDLHLKKFLILEYLHFGFYTLQEKLDMTKVLCKFINPAILSFIVFFIFHSSTSITKRKSHFC